MQWSAHYVTILFWHIHEDTISYILKTSYFRWIEKVHAVIYLLIALWVEESGSENKLIRNTTNEMDFRCVIKLKSEYDSNFKLQKVAERTFNCNSLICEVIYVYMHCCKNLLSKKMQINLFSEPDSSTQSTINKYIKASKYIF